MKENERRHVIHRRK